MKVLTIAWFLLVALTGEGQPELEANIRIEVPDGPVSFGEPFPLTVVREWSSGAEVDPWRDAALAPLRTRSLETRVVEQDGLTKETRRFEAMAFDLFELRLPAVELRVRSVETGTALIVSSSPVTLEVQGTLDPSAPGDVEWPRPIAEAPVDWLAWGARGVGAAALLLLVVCLARGRRRAPDTAELTTPAESARRDLEVIRTGDVDRASAVHGVVRRYLEERFALPAMEASSEELIASERLLSVVGSESQERLGQLLQRLDLARFAGPVSTAVEPWIDEALAWITDVEMRRGATEVDRDVA